MTGTEMITKLNDDAKMRDWALHLELTVPLQENSSLTQLDERAATDAHPIPTTGTTQDGFMTL